MRSVRTDESFQQPREAVEHVVAMVRKASGYMSGAEEWRRPVGARERDVLEPDGTAFPRTILCHAAQAQPDRLRAHLRPRTDRARNAVVGLENVALWHERDISHSSAERVVLPDAFLAVDYMLDRFAWLLEGLVVRTERMRENLDASHRLYFSQRLLLALVESGRSRDDAYRLVQRHAMRAWDEGLDFPELVRADAEIAGAVELDAVFDLGAYTRNSASSSTACVPCARSTCMPEAAVHLASGKVRELYALDDERLLLVASDRISTFDVILPTEIPDKGRVLTGLSAFWFARTQGIVPNHLLGASG